MAPGPGSVVGPAAQEQQKQPARYEVEHAAHGDKYTINGESFEAKTHCRDLEKGDSVVFLQGAATGACTSAKVLNLRNKQKCELWCE